MLRFLVEDGETPGRYLPEGVRVPSRNGREITLLDLATHACWSRWGCG